MAASPKAAAPWPSASAPFNPTPPAPASRGREARTVVIPRERGVFSTLRLLDSITGTSGILDHPLFADDDERWTWPAPSDSIFEQSIPHGSAFPRRKAPELCSGHSPSESEGAGNAGRLVRPHARGVGRKHA